MKWKRGDRWPSEGVRIPEFWEQWFHSDQLQLVGYYDLDHEAQEAVHEIFWQDLSEVVAAMWWNNAPVANEIYEARLAKFPVGKVWIVDSIIDRCDTEYRDDVLRVVAMLRNIGLEEQKCGERS